MWPKLNINKETKQKTQCSEKREQESSVSLLANAKRTITSESVQFQRNCKQINHDCFKRIQIKIIFPCQTDKHKISE